MNDILYVLRKTHNQTETEVAKVLDIPVTYYQKLEAGEVDVTFDQSKILSGHYNVDPSFFPLKRNAVINYNHGSSYNFVIQPQKYFAAPTENQLKEASED